MPGQAYVAIKIKQLTPSLSTIPPLKKNNSAVLSEDHLIWRQLFALDMGSVSLQDSPQGHN